MLYPLSTEQAWWSRAIDGVAAILFGLAALLWPGLALFTLVAIFAIYAIIRGLVALVGMFRAIGANATWWPYLIIAVASIAAGVLVFAYPGVTAVFLLYVIALWAIGVGMVEIVAAVFGARWLLMITGVISILFGFVLLASPLAGALALVTVIGAFAIVRGILELVGLVQAPSSARLPG